MRVQVELPGMAGYGAVHTSDKRPKALHDQPLFDPASAMGQEPAVDQANSADG